MSIKKEMIPEWQQVIDFEGDALIITMVASVVYVALKPIVDILGLEWSGQYRRTMRDVVLSQHVVLCIRCANDGKRRGMIALQLEYLPGWLFGVTPSRIKPEIAQRLLHYKEHCFHVLWKAWQASLYNSGHTIFAEGHLVSVAETDLQRQSRATLAYHQLIAETVQAQRLRAEKENLIATLTIEQWLHTLAYFEGLCAYCRYRTGVVLEHFVPLSLGGGTTFDNCVPSCYSCNAKKGRLHPDEVKEISKEALKRIRTYFALINRIDE